VVEFIDALARDNWIATPDTPGTDASIYRRLPGPETASILFPITAEWLSQVSGEELLLGFAIEHADKAGLTYPLVNIGAAPEEPYYDIQIHLTDDYVCHESECISPMVTLWADVRCRCREELAYYPDDHVFYSPRIHYACPNCGLELDASTIPIEVRDGWTAERSLIPGGAICRFAVMIDCGNCVPEHGDEPFRAHPALIGLCERTFARPFYEIGTPN
jgi:hypothetical protein